MDPGIVYVLTNEAMPNLVKIGRTTDSVEKRMADLSTHSGVPLLFECYFAVEVQDAARIEKTLHQLFSEYRVNPKREFFRLDPEKVVVAISIGAFKEVTPGMLNTPSIDLEEKEALEKAKARRPKLRLDAIKIKPGDVLHFARDEAVTATVVTDGKVDFEGETMSLAAAALKVLGRMGYTTSAASGSINWMFDGELLDERRRRIEAEQFEQPGSEG
jgi:T5orf172 domain